jgi:cobalt-precorrin 5A hydrolase/precorrin-3B C17-methyltransferase
VIGLGPGDTRWRTPEADAALTRATHIVGYQGYLNLLGAPDPGKRYHAYELGEESRRVSAALALAGKGESVALVCSGDAGIYAMASLVFETLEHCNEPAWMRIAVTVVPGISALQAAAARVGAPLGHDFCAVSLSDLLTPWSAIEQRLRAAAQGDFVVALYNPFSQRRRTHLARAARILLASRPATTPVAVARNLGRDGETVELTTLGELERLEADMLTILVVGASQSRRMRMPDGTERMYTPRGYSTKTQSGAAA